MILGPKLPRKPIGVLSLEETSQGVLAIGGGYPHIIGGRKEIWNLKCLDDQIEHCHWQVMEQKLEFARTEQVTIPLALSYDICNRAYENSSDVTMDNYPENITQLSSTSGNRGEAEESSTPFSDTFIQLFSNTTFGNIGEGSSLGNISDVFTQLSQVFSNWTFGTKETVGNFSELPLNLTQN